MKRIRKIASLFWPAVALLVLIGSRFYELQTQPKSTRETRAPLPPGAVLQFCPKVYQRGSTRLNCLQTTEKLCAKSTCCWSKKRSSDKNGPNCYAPQCPRNFPVEERIKCNYQTPFSCFKNNCCWDPPKNDDVPGPSCFEKPKPKETPEPNINPAPSAKCHITHPPYTSRLDCGNASTTLASCVDSGCCWGFIGLPITGPICYHPQTANPDQCVSIGTDRVACLDKLTYDQCNSAGCCWRPTIENGVPACFKAVAAKPLDMIDTCKVPFPPYGVRTDCGNEKSTPESCKLDGCCWGYLGNDIPITGPLCFRPLKVLESRCRLPVKNRESCGDVNINQNDCDTLQCCFRPLGINEVGPACFKPGPEVVEVNSPAVVAPTVAGCRPHIPYEARINCGDETTTEGTCSGLGCCWGYLGDLAPITGPICYKKPIVSPALCFVQTSLRVRCNFASAEECDVGGCCWRPLAAGIFGEACFKPNPEVSDVAKCEVPHQPFHARVDCGNVRSNPGNCKVFNDDVKKTCCWGDHDEETPVDGPICYQAHKVSESKCEVIPTNRLNCGYDNFEDCNNNHCCWRPLRIGEEGPTCFIPSRGRPLGTCPLLLGIERTDCLKGTQAECELVGCCWNILGPKVPGPYCYRNINPPPPPIFSLPKNTGSYKLGIKEAPFPAIHVAVVPRTNKVILLERFDMGEVDSEHSAELDFKTGSFRVLKTKTDIFCSGGIVLSDSKSRLLNVGGWSDYALTGVRIITPTGSEGIPGTSDWFEDPGKLTLVSPRWYPSVLQLPSGEIGVISGESNVWNRGANANLNLPLSVLEPTIEFIPPRATNNLIQIQILVDSDPANLYPGAHVLPDGTVFIFSGYESAVFDAVNFKELRRMPKSPGKRSYPLAGASFLAPLYPPHYTAEVIVCGGSSDFSTNSPALDDCVSINPMDPSPYWLPEKMPSARVLGDYTILPDGTYLVTGGAHVGWSGFGGVPGTPNAPNLQALLYDPSKPHHQRFSILASTTTPRLYHGWATLLPNGTVLIGGSTPNVNNKLKKDPTKGIAYENDYSMELYTPPYLSTGAERPVIVSPAPVDALKYGSEVVMTVMVPSNGIGNIKLNLVLDGFVTHNAHMNQRLVGLQIKSVVAAKLRKQFTVTVVMPPNSAVCPPGWYMMFLLDGATPSVAQWYWMGGDLNNIGSYPSLV